MSCGFAIADRFLSLAGSSRWVVLDVGWMHEAKVEVCNQVGRSYTEEDLTSGCDSQNGVVVNGHARGLNLLFIDVGDSVHRRQPIDLATPQAAPADVALSLRGDVRWVWARHNRGSRPTYATVFLPMPEIDERGRETLHGFSSY